ncbi:MAG: DUF1080 domain-containing protein [Gemmataceae bacterium]|nr:DUF1080 domain-containing protein [Gemmataceae bacterium]
MPTSPTPQLTDFTFDVLGRYTCNGLDEALKSADASQRPDARPFDIVILGGGSFGGVLAQHLFFKDAAHSHRILVLEAGRFVLTEHQQNLPMMSDIFPAVADTPWRSALSFPGLAYCLGGRSCFFGGWSPQPLDTTADTELPTARWPSAVVVDLNDKYFKEAREQLGTNQANDFVFGPLHEALRERLFDALNANQVAGAIPLGDLPLFLDDVPAGQEDLHKLEAPLAVQSHPPRPGAYAGNKFSSVPLLMAAARAAYNESANDDVKKRLMIVPFCYVSRLVTTISQGMTRVTELITNQGPITLPPHGKVIIALGTIESARLARISFPLLPNTNLIGQNLMAHLRSNVNIRIPRAALPPGMPNQLASSALFVKGKHQGSYFHLQITASGLAKPGDSETELFKLIPDVDNLDAFKAMTDDHVVITIRGIGEMEPLNPASSVTLGGELDGMGMPRAQVQITPSAKDMALWRAMDETSDAVAKAFANGQNFHVQAASGFVQVTPASNLELVLPYTPKEQGGRRDGLGTTHHEAGTLRLGDNATTSVTDANARFHHVANAFVAGPAVFPTVGSPNPMLTGTALARRLGDHLAFQPPPTPSPGFTMLFDGVHLDKWRMSTIINQPGRDNPGRFQIVDAALEAVTGTDIGLLWCTEPTPPNFVLKLEWRCWQASDNSGVVLRFPDPTKKNYNNTAFVAVDFGFEVQIDQLAAPDGAPNHLTGAIYNFAAPSNPGTLPVRPLGEWNEYEIRVDGQTYKVHLNGSLITTFNFTPGSDAQHPDRGLPSTPQAPRFIGLQTHTGRVAFRNIQIMDLAAVQPAAMQPPHRTRERVAQPSSVAGS